MDILTTNHISPGVYITEIDKTNNLMRRKGGQSYVYRDKSKGGGESGIDEFLRGIAYTDSECSWSEDEKKMLLNFYNMNGEIMTTIYLFDTNSDGDILLDAGEFT